MSFSIRSVSSDTQEENRAPDQAYRTFEVNLNMVKIEHRILVIFSIYIYNIFYSNSKKDLSISEATFILFSLFLWNVRLAGITPMLSPPVPTL